MDYQEIGDRIRMLRLRKNLTQEEFSEELEISPSYMGQIERGQRKASIKTLERIGKALNVPLEVLLHDLNTEEHFHCIWDKKGKALTQEEKENVLTVIEVILDLLNRRK